MCLSIPHVKDNYITFVAMGLQVPFRCWYLSKWVGHERLLYALLQSYFAGSHLGVSMCSVLCIHCANEKDWISALQPASKKVFGIQACCRHLSCLLQVGDALH